MKSMTTFATPAQNTIFDAAYIKSLIEWCKKNPIPNKPTEPKDYPDYRMPTWIPKPIELSDEQKKEIENLNTRLTNYIGLSELPVNFKSLNLLNS